MFTLILGGARSGKSALAEEIGRREVGPVTFVATCPDIPGDDDLTRRVERHRAERPTEWRTIEEEVELADAIERAGDDLVIVDCLTLWVGNLQHHGYGTDAMADASRAALDVIARRRGDTVVVTNEVGLGIVPADVVSREYRDVLGRLNREWAAAADRPLFLVAGRALPLLDPGSLLG